MSYFLTFKLQSSLLPSSLPNSLSEPPGTEYSSPEQYGTLKGPSGRFQREEEKNQPKDLSRGATGYPYAHT